MCCDLNEWACAVLKAQLMQVTVDFIPWRVELWKSCVLLSCFSELGQK